MSAHERLEELLARWFVEPAEPRVEQLLRDRLAQGIVRIDDLARVFDHLQRCRALPRRPEQRFVHHFLMWLEIINHARFIPIITAARRLDTLASLLETRLPTTLDRTHMTIVDVGTGQPPHTTIELAARFFPATVHGFDLYRARALVHRPDGAYAVFDERGTLRGVHSSATEQLHAMVIDWETTRSEFERRRVALEAIARDGVAADDGWRLVEQPGRALLDAAGQANVEFHCVDVGDFQLAPLADQSVDVVWSFNCLLHYPRARRAALASLARCCRVGGLVMEGYTSPTGGHAVYQLWRRDLDSLIPIEFGWTLSNLRRPLWPLAGHDPQVAVLAGLLADVKDDPEIAAYSQSAEPRALEPGLLERLLAQLERCGRPAAIVDQRFVVQWDPLESTCRHASLSIL